MKATIGNQLLRRIEPGEKPYEIHDQRMKGFLLRIQPSGTMTYIAQYRRGKRIALGRADVLKPSDAREVAKKILGDAMRGIDPMAAKRAEKSHTLETFLKEEYEPWARAHLRSADATVKRIKVSFSKYQTTKLHEFEPRSIERWRTKRFNDGRKPATVNRDLISLKAALSKAVEWGFIDTHPLAKVKKSKVDNNSVARYLSETEAQKLFEALEIREERIRVERTSANKWRSERGVEFLPDLREYEYADHLRPMVLLSLNTGMRRGELFNLHWSDINFRGKILTVRGEGAKSGKTRHIPLNQLAMHVLQNWQEQLAGENDLVFVGKTGGKFDNVNKSWREVLLQAEIENFRWHDLRHTFASWLVMKNVDLNTVRELLGHSDMQMTLRYAHLAPEHKADAVSKLD
ncbi:MAG: site-specific integrase [Sneathiella sp.]|nr:site-specific integrase [Sneathiella sp.]